MPGKGGQIKKREKKTWMENDERLIMIFTEFNKAQERKKQNEICNKYHSTRFAVNVP